MKAYMSPAALASHRAIAARSRRPVHASGRIVPGSGVQPRTKAAALSSTVDVTRAELDELKARAGLRGVEVIGGVAAAGRFDVGADSDGLASRGHVEPQPADPRQFTSTPATPPGAAYPGSWRRMLGLSDVPGLPVNLP